MAAIMTLPEYPGPPALLPNPEVLQSPQLRRGWRKVDFAVLIFVAAIVLLLLFMFFKEPLDF